MREGELDGSDFAGNWQSKELGSCISDDSRCPLSPSPPVSLLLGQRCLSMAAAVLGTRDTALSWSPAVACVLLLPVFRTGRPAGSQAGTD